jgi:tetratricopeptide (TPR) repeat protein
VKVLSFSAALLVAVVVSAFAQEGQSAQQLYEAGKYGEALQAVQQQRERGAAGPDDTYLAGQILLRLDQGDNAKREFEGLTSLGDEGWQLVGESARALVDNDTQRALETATQATAVASDRFAAHYQLGLVQARREDFDAAASAFERAVELNPTFAYAHYYAGAAYSQIRRSDRTSYFFERFLKLAPDAPERTAVMSIMRTLRR